MEYKIRNTSVSNRYSLGHFTLRLHTAVALDKVLLAAEDGEGHEQLTDDGRDGRHSYRRVHVEAVEHNRINFTTIIEVKLYSFIADCSPVYRLWTYENYQKYFGSSETSI